MKKIIRLVSVILSVLTVVILVSCGGVTPAIKQFSRGTVSGNIYTNSFAELTFTKPDDWEYLNDNDIAALQGKTAELFDEEAFNAASEGSVIDMYVLAGTGDNVNISFSKGGAFTDVNKCVTATVDEIKNVYEGAGYAVTVGSPETVSLAGLDFRMVSIEVSVLGISMTQYCYLAKVGVYIVAITCTTTSGMTEAQFEAMFSKAA